MILRFKIWHYTGTLLYERPWNKQEELWEVLWQKFPPGIFKAPVIRYKPVEGIQPSQPVGRLYYNYELIYLSLNILSFLVI